MNSSKNERVQAQSDVLQSDILSITLPMINRMKIEIYKSKSKIL